VRKLVGAVSKTLGRIGIDVDDGAVAFHLVDANDMRHLNRHRGHRLTGLTVHTEVAGVPGRTSYDHVDVYLLRGMPRVQMTAAIAHELTHVWTLLNCRMLVNHTLAEGSCQYAAYVVLKDIPGAESEYLIHTMNDDSDRAYGKGFRRVRAYVEENGTHRWLTLLENSGSLSTH
jgi:hypothetical protein